MGPSLSFYVFGRRLPSEIVTMNEMGGETPDVLCNDFRPCDSISFWHMVIADQLFKNVF